MRVAVMGAGGVGGYFGGLLANGGNDVTLIARGAHLTAIQRQGLRVMRQQGQFTVQVKATDDPGNVGPVELVLFTVKTYHNQDALKAIRPLMGDDTTVLTLQNGVESYREVAEVVGEGKVLPGAAYIESRIAAPGVVQQTGSVVRVVFGEANGRETARAKKLLGVCREAWGDTELSRDIFKALWTKFLFIATVAGVTSAARTRLNECLRYPGLQAMVLQSMGEIQAVGRSQGVVLEPKALEDTLAYIEGSAREIVASMHLDLDHGRPLELEALSGAVVRLGRQAGVATPLHQFFYSVLKPHIKGKRVSIPT